MSDSIVVALLVLSILLVVSLRAFFPIPDRRDAMAVLAILAPAVCLLSFLVWGMEFPGVLVGVLSALTLLENFHSLWRFLGGLYVDSFSPMMRLVSAVNVLLVLAAGALVFVLRPVPLPGDLPVDRSQVLLSGSVHAGFVDKVGMRQSVDVVVLQFEPGAGTAAAAGDVPLVLWVADPRTTGRRLELSAALLAARGYRVVVADFGTDMVDSFRRRTGALLAPEEFSVLEPVQSREISLRYCALLDYYGGREEPGPVFLVGDRGSAAAVAAAAALYPDVAGFYVIDGRDSLGIPHAAAGWVEGFGPVAESAPWVNWCLRGGWPLGSRDAAAGFSMDNAGEMDEAFSRMLSEKEVEDDIEPIG